MILSVVDGCSMWNQSEPVWVSLRHLSPGTDAVAAQWSQRGPDKQGGWSQEGCQLVHSDSSTSALRCSMLSNYAVLQVCYKHNIDGLCEITGSDYSVKHPFCLLPPRKYLTSQTLHLCL